MKKGFTLVELLAVIAILAILVIIALPNVMGMFNTAKENSFKTEVKEIYKTAQQQWIQDSMYSTGEQVYKRCSGCSGKSLNLSGRSELDYYIKLNKSGKVVEYYATDGTFQYSFKDPNGLEIENINTVQKVADLTDENDVIKITNSGTSGGGSVTVNECTYNGELTQGAVFVDGNYTYRYKQRVELQEGIPWIDMTEDGWGVAYYDPTNQHTGTMCSSINGKPIVATSSMFINMEHIDDINLNGFDFTKLNTSNVKYMDGMFAGIRTNNFDLSHLDTSNVVNMQAMFEGTYVQSIDLRNFDTSKVTNMRYMFSSSKASSILFGNSFDTSKIDDMVSMFSGCQNLTSLDLSMFNTEHVKTMSDMFNGATSLTNLNVSNFITTDVLHMSYMFYNTPNLTTIDLSSFDTSGVNYTNYMFHNTGATIGYAKTQADADKFNSSSGKPTTLTFTVKN